MNKGQLKHEQNTQMAHSVTILHKIKDTLGDRNINFLYAYQGERKPQCPKPNTLLGTPTKGLGSWAA